jgi:hypothetical protein
MCLFILPVFKVCGERFVHQITGNNFRKTWYLTCESPNTQGVAEINDTDQRLWDKTKKDFLNGHIFK